MDAQTPTPPSAAHLQLDSPMRPQVIKFCYKKRHTGHSRNGKDDSSQDPKSQPPSSPLSRPSLSTSAIPTYHAGGFYEIDHERLPPRTPIHLKSIRMVKVSEYTSLDITVSFPSLLALRSFIARHSDSSKEDSIGGYETEASVKKQQPPAQQEDKKNSVSGKRKRDLAERSNKRMQVEELAGKLNDVKWHMEQLSSNMVQVGEEAKSEAERVCSSWKFYAKSQPPSSPLSRPSLSTSAIPTCHVGGFYEIDHERLPPRTPIHLKSICVVKVSEYTSLDITVSFPSLLALRSFFSSFPELERFVMSSNHAACILRRRVAEQELKGGMHEDSFWLVNPCLDDFSVSSHPATLPDALSSPEAPPPQPKAPAPSSCLLDTLKCDGAGWGVQHRFWYIGRHRDASKEASIGGYETEYNAKEKQCPTQQEDKRSSVSGKRKLGDAERSNDKPSKKRSQVKDKNGVNRIVRATFIFMISFTLFTAVVVYSNM